MSSKARQADSEQRSVASADVLQCVQLVVFYKFGSLDIFQKLFFLNLQLYFSTSANILIIKNHFQGI